MTARRTDDPIVEVFHHSVRVSPKTVWQFVELITAQGLRGVGEATLPDNADLSKAVEAVAPDLLGRLPASGCPDTPPQTAKLHGAAVRSSVDAAMHDLAAQQAGLSLGRSLAEPRRSRIPLYANINRRTIDRSPEGFATSARSGLCAGHESFKIAPFDELTPDLAGAALTSALNKGFARIAAVRDTIGADRRLMIDCHWRCSAASADMILRESAGLALYWVECPVIESFENIPLLARLRETAQRLGLRLAGCEENISLDGFAPFISGGAYDVLMPDVKYAGGMREFLDVAGAAADAGIDIAPHNPSGPVSHLISLQLCAVIPNLLMLELQFSESGLFETLVDTETPKVARGETEVLHNCPGLAAHLVLPEDESVVSSRWSVGG